MSAFTKSKSERRRFLTESDPIINVAVLALSIIGVILVYAATRDWFAANNQDPEYYLKRQLINVVIGIALAYGATLVDYRVLRAYTPILWGIGVLGLTAVLIPGLGSVVNGARSWISLPGGFQIQPAELAKLTIIVGMALILAEREAGEKGPSDRQVLYSLVVAAVPILLIVLQPDLGTVLIISAAVLSIIAISGARLRWVIGLLVVGISGAYIAVASGEVSDYQLNRLRSFIDPYADPQASGYQLRQARITIGSGGLLGKGLFDGPQTNGRFVPEQQTDFIFTVSGEELGFLGSSFILLLYATILMRGFAIAKRTNDLFGRLVTMGVVAWFSFQIFQNIGMTMGLMPMTGVPLPFLSYGGSSMFANMIAIGLLQNVYQRSR
ncbi:MAG: rod shape-determining protein RodA [Candidatus Nanopelagicaceae bacterium]|nr:rod shape-determining protein RodA [Actinomycetota bacterium]NCV43547.1 rod shape-determining protein RodA [Actinomycetota bacterium]NCV83758.1 rod shape-determining protein RodA [Actinomycetota bacterium]NCV95554.1 rod shape-determining protein RodA [Actinomycetota bacterium]NCW47338.1 rod shape-determining protein RodA [Actinomycetota bacterium]